MLFIGECFMCQSFTGVLKRTSRCPHALTIMINHVNIFQLTKRIDMYKKSISERKSSSEWKEPDHVGGKWCMSKHTCMACTERWKEGGGDYLGIWNSLRSSIRFPFSSLNLLWWICQCSLCKQKALCIISAWLISSKVSGQDSISQSSQCKAGIQPQVNTNISSPNFGRL